MSIVTLMIVLVIVGVALYLINKYIPMDGKIKTILNWAVVIIVILWLLSRFGIFNSIQNVRI